MNADPIARLSGSWSKGSTLSLAEYVRVVLISQKLGRLAIDITTSSTIQPFPALSMPDSPKTWDQAAESHLSTALTAMLRMGLANRAPNSSQQVVVGRDVNPTISNSPEEATLRDAQAIGVTMEMLSEVYGRQGKNDLAGQLLIQALSTLLPPQATETPPIADRCQGRSFVKPLHLLLTLSSGKCR